MDLIRALAAESRMRATKNNCSSCGKVLESGVGKTFEKSVYKYCSMVCLTQQRELHN
jgi:hypothetical protein